MSIFVSPGVYSRELDYSFYVSSLSSCIVGMVGTAEKGELNKAILITSPEQFMRVFGEPNLNSYAGYAALQYLAKGNKLYFVRVASEDAAKASITINDGANESPKDVLKISAKSEGEWGNDIAITISNVNNTAKTFDLEVYYKGKLVEKYTGLSMVATSGNYVETVLGSGNKKSSYITVDDLISDNSTMPKEVTKQALTGGDAGWEAEASDYIGQITGTTKTGLEVFSNPEEIDINLLAVPGVSDMAVHSKMLSICEARGDCFAILDPPLGLDVQGVVDFHNGEGDFEGTRQALNSSYGALYWPWVKVYDAYNDVYLWSPPSGFVLGQIAYNDSVAYTWSAPAGWNRGRIIEAVGLEYSPSQGERDILYSGGNCINPLVNFAGRGIVIWGQRTLFRGSSAVDRINVRRMMLYIRKAIATASAYLVFEPNNATTWRRFKMMVEPFLSSIKTKGGLYDFKVVMDESVNTSDVIDNNQLVGKIYLKPTKTAEIITLDFVLVPTGAKFEEV